MASYAVSAVRYDSDRCFFYKVRVHRVRAGGVDAPMEVLRAQLVSALEFGTTFTAIRPGQQGGYAAHAPVRLVRLGENSYLRCDGADAPADHLPHVAEF